MFKFRTRKKQVGIVFLLIDMKKKHKYWKRKEPLSPNKRDSVRAVHQLEEWNFKWEKGICNFLSHWAAGYSEESEKPHLCSRTFLTLGKDESMGAVD